MPSSYPLVPSGSNRRKPRRPLVDRTARRLGKSRRLEIHFARDTNLHLLRERSEKVASYGSAVGGLAAAVAVLVAALTLNASNATNDRQRDETRKVQLAQRFDKAVEQLSQEGDANLNTRLAGIYSLERIMRETPTEAPVTIQILSTFLRLRAAFPAQLEGLTYTTNIEVIQQQTAKLEKNPVDVEAALAALGRRPEPKLVAHRIDLRGLHFRLHEANFAGTNLMRTYLAFANFHAADLEKVDLFCVDFSAADLSYTNLRNANLTEARLLNADLTGADLRGASLGGTSLTMAELRQADLRGTDLTRVIGLKAVQLEEALVDETTKMPPNFDSAGVMPSSALNCP